ncbi:hypothetical protein [Chitinilyticum piscinae]|uniref:Uncharacterized protein n=1 Tax=Chitinilyticum piscinae TaxID=2866724 RepID=A0A8J7FYK1_9NEIS|nr:hypothetical protein [Chitinilyticum piscinae]MBE9608720.1 hypothetical protein [Chitinilyticum piscinae]
MSSDNTLASLTPQEADFSLVLGGPLYQLLLRAHLSGDTLQLLSRRILVLTGVAWLPLLLLTVQAGTAWGGQVALPFLYSIDIHVRLLIALPLLVVAELIVHQRMLPVIGQFVLRGLVSEADRERFDDAIASALRWRNSLTAEVILLALVYVVGVGVIWRTQTALEVSSWYAGMAEGHFVPTLAGWWLGCVSLPLFQFLLLRWYYRIFIWIRFLWQVSRIRLQLCPLHPDRCGGMGFLGSISYAFTPLLAAQGVVMAGMIADRIFHTGAKLLEFRLELTVLVAFAVAVVLLPMLLFSMQLSQARRQGSREVGMLALRYARDFDQKWLRGGAPADEPLLGSGDIQSLADLGNSFTVITEMKLVPFSKRTVLQLVGATLLPVAPLTLTMISLDELLSQLFKILL